MPEKPMSKRATPPQHHIATVLAGAKNVFIFCPGCLIHLKEITVLFIIFYIGITHGII